MLGVEAGVGLVEQPELGVAGHQGGQRRPPPLAGGQGAHRRGGQPARQAQPVEGRPTAADGPARGAHREAHVLGRAQVVVEGGGMTEQPDPPADRPRVGDQIGAEDRGLAS